MLHPTFFCSSFLSTSYQSSSYLLFYSYPLPHPLVSTFLLFFSSSSSCILLYTSSVFPVLSFRLLVLPLLPFLFLFLFLFFLLLSITSRTSNKNPHRALPSASSPVGGHLSPPA